MMLPRYKVADKEAAKVFVLEHRTELDNLVEHSHSGYEYFSVYYSENDEPLGWEDGSALEEEKEGFFVQRGSYYAYETEKITDHWYYY